MSSRVTSLIEMKCLFGGGAGGRRSSRMTRISAVMAPLLWRWDEQNAVDRAERGGVAGPLLDKPPQSLCERDTPRLDADQRDACEVRIGLDDLVRDPRERPAKRFRVHQDLVRGSRRRQLHSTPFRPHW